MLLDELSGRLVLEREPLRLLQLLARGEAKLIAKDAARLLIGLQRLRSLAGKREGSHVDGTQPLPQGKAADEGGNLGRHLLGASGFEFRTESPFETFGLQLLQLGNRHRRE